MNPGIRFDHTVITVDQNRVVHTLVELQAPNRATQFRTETGEDQHDHH